MSLSSMKQEELELLSYTDLTELILMENKTSMNTANIFKKISELLSLTEEEYASKIGDFYTSLTTDKRFIFLEDSAEWDLRNRHTAEIVVTDDDDFKPGFFDEEDDEFFQTLDEQHVDHYSEYERQHQVHTVSNTQLPPTVIKIELNPDGSVKKITQNKK